MLLEHLIFTFEGNMTLQEACPTESGGISTEWQFFKSASIRLSVTCSLSSPKINCGALRMTSRQTKLVKIKPARMEVIRLSHIEEQKATLNKEDFMISKESKIEKKFRPFQLSSWLNMSWKYLSIIGLRKDWSKTLVILGLWVCNQKMDYMIEVLL